MDVGNPAISGVILTQDLEAAESTVVYLLPNDFNPQIDSVDTLTMKTTTDINGNYYFYNNILENQYYTLWAEDSIDNKKLISFKTNINIDDTGKILYTILKEAVDLIIYIPETTSTENIYAYIPGTPRTSNFSLSSQHGDSVLILLSVPQGVVPPINIAENSSSFATQLTDTLILNSDSIQSTTAFEVWSNFTPQNSEISKDTIYSVAFDSQGSFWFGTFGAGIYQLSGNNWTNYSESNGLPYNVNLCFIEDSVSNMWCGTGAGVAWISSGQINTFNSDSINIPQSSIFEIERDTYNRLWFATSEGVFLNDHNTWTKYDTSNSDIPNNLIYSVCWRQDSLFVGTFGGGLAIFSSNGWDTLTMENSPLLSNHIYSVKKDNDNTVWLATTRGLVIYKENNWTIVNEELPDESIWALAPDNLGGAWLGTQKGIVRYKNGIRKIFTPKNSTFLSSQIFAITANETGVLFGTGKGATVLEYR